MNRRMLGADLEVSAIGPGVHGHEFELPALPCSFA